jgi:hypothetical protein
MSKLTGLLVVVLGLAPWVGAQERAEVGPSGASTPAAGPTGSLWSRQEAVLFDNGPLVNSPGTGPGGADESLARDATVGLTSRGFNVAQAGGYRVADDFTVPAGGWDVATITLVPYMAGSPTAPSPITGVNLQIRNGEPGQAGSSVVWGDSTTNRLASTVFAEVYRRLESEPGDASRPVMAAVASVGTTLAAGTYWLDWQVDGDSSYNGPWAPPVTVDGQTTTGNALLWNGVEWVAVVDSGLQTPQGLPFVVDGTPVPVELTSFAVE